MSGRDNDRPEWTAGARRRGIGAALAELAGDLALGVRFVFGGGRTSWVRLALTAFGVGFGVAVLLYAAAAPNAYTARSVREDARMPMDKVMPDRDPLLLVPAQTAYRQQRISGVQVQSTGSRMPLPPGVDRLPGPDELVVSPGLAKLLASRDGELLRPRFPQPVVGQIGEAGLMGPDELFFYQGTTGLTASGDRTPGGAMRAYSFGRQGDSIELSQLVALLLVAGTVVLLVPVLAFVAAATRIAAAARDRRLAAIRLVGATSGQARRIAAAETLAAAVVGVVVGGLLFLVGRQLFERLGLFRVGLFASDLQPPLAMVILILVGVPLLAVLTAVLALRRAVVEPLGVVRSTRPIRRRLWWRLAILVIGAGLLLTQWRTDSFSRAVVIAGVVLTVAAIPVLLPWLLELVVRGLHGGPTSWLLAVRRLQLDSASAARVVAGVATVLAGGIALQTLLGTVGQASTRRTGDDPNQISVSVDLGPKPGVDVFAGLAKLRDIPGVHDVRVDVQVSAVSNAGSGKSALVVIGPCDRLRQLAAIDSCQDGSVFLVSQNPDGRVSERVPNPGSVVRFGFRGNPATWPTWTVPADARTVNSLPGDYNGTSTILATPAALPIPATGAFISGQARIDPADPDGIEIFRNEAAVLGPRVNVEQPAAFQVDANYTTVRAGLLTGAAIALLLTVASLLVVALEQIRERRRPIAVLAAAGVKRSTLVISVLWQFMLPMLAGTVLAIGVGIGLSQLLVGVVRSPGNLDWLGIGVLSGVAVSSALLATLMTLPSLRRATRPEGLRME